VLSPNASSASSTSEAGPLATVESFDHATEHNERLTVEDAMVIFKSCLDDEKQCNELDANLPGLSLALAHSCRESLGRSWGYEVKQLEGDYQQLAFAYQARLLAKSADPKTPSRRCVGEGSGAQAAGGTLDSPNRCVVRPAHAREASNGWQVEGEGQG
jgi:hypothetical protein